MRPINVVGAGFSGLTTAYFLVRAGRNVRVFEKSDRAGGLIRSIRTEHGLIETAANGILNSARLEQMCAEIGVPMVHPQRDGRRRFIYRNKPRQLPLTPTELGRLALGLATNLHLLRPREGESVESWGARVLGKDATDFLLSPALGGIYAGDPSQLSASLIFGRAALPDHLQTTRPAKARVRGTVAPPNGMQQLIDRLFEYLRATGVEFVFNHEAALPPNESTITCLSARAAANYLAPRAPELARRLSEIEMLSLVTATLFFEADAARLKGFGCLFPRNQGFRARGVLFNDCIFPGRGPAHGETWILGGALDPNVVSLNDEELTAVILADRERFFGQSDQPISVHLTRWPNALPHYSIALEQNLVTLPAPPPNLALVGNYLGRIGLAKILERAHYVAEHVARAWT
jgi:protoporphyrinogen/coproporphyrinogen III oxidase